MSTANAPQPLNESRQQRGVLCLGEPFVDLICERHVEGLAQARSFNAHFGGTVANVALLAARAGAYVELAGAIGDDPFGEWLRDSLEGAGVDCGRLRPTAGVGTRIALVTVDASGEANYVTYGDEGGSVSRTLAADLETAVAANGGLFLGSNTLVAEDDRELTLRARDLALQADRPVVFDPNLHLGRWGSRAAAAAAANACVPGATLVRASLAEAQLMTGEDDLERAALALLKAGARNVVLSLGPRGAVLRGKLKLDVPGVPARVLSTIGAGDVLTAQLLARLEASGWYEPVIAAGLREAVAASARACERWGAVD